VSSPTPNPKEKKTTLVLSSHHRKTRSEIPQVQTKELADTKQPSKSQTSSPQPKLISKSPSLVPPKQTPSVVQQTTDSKKATLGRKKPQPKFEDDSEDDDDEDEDEDEDEYPAKKGSQQVKGNTKKGK